MAKRKCSVANCDQDHEARGYCKKHYRANFPVEKCSVHGCENRKHSRGLCSTHSSRLYKRGSINADPLIESHGMNRTTEYNVWNGMRARCHNKNEACYPRYGGRGITVCEEWKNSFSSFFKDMGRAPAGCQIDRIDNEKGYSKENCRWVSPQENAQNRRSNKLSIDDVKMIRASSMSIYELAEQLQVNYSVVWNALRGRTWRNIT
jgi:hypothetical protein